MIRRLLLIEHLQNAYHSLRMTRLRTLLTTTGVAIGVASVTIILALSSGITSVISGQVDKLGGNIAVVRPGSPDQKKRLSNPTIEQAYTTSTLSEQDVLDLQQINQIDAVAPLMLINGSLKTKNTTVTSGNIIATTPDLETIAQLPVKDGQFIDSVTNRDTAVIGSNLSIELFGTEQSIGQTFTLRKQAFTIIGVLKPLKDPVNYNTVDFDNSLIISLDSGKSFHEGVPQIQQINVRAKNTAALPEAIAAANKTLLKNHHDEQDFSILSGTQIAEPSSHFFNVLTTIMTIIAAISLVVGGIGIMNIMLVGVAERTREIGLRKSVGASNRNIVLQFMTEALIISLAGGLIGYIAGYAIAFIISTFLTFSPAFTWQIAFVAFILSVGVGTLFGIYPALRAARKDPIESLRHHH